METADEGQNRHLMNIVVFYSKEQRAFFDQPWEYASIMINKGVLVKLHVGEKMTEDRYEVLTRPAQQLLPVPCWGTLEFERPFNLYDDSLNKFSGILNDSNLSEHCCMSDLEGEYHKGELSFTKIYRFEKDLPNPQILKYEFKLGTGGGFIGNYRFIEPKCFKDGFAICTIADFSQHWPQF